MSSTSRLSPCVDISRKNGMTMDEREMTSGVIPLRHASLPGLVKLPRRYEKAAMGSNGIPTRVRKISIQPGTGVLGDSLSNRLDDLMSAIMWVKQELIMLRQHDVLLKRQFFDIRHSIQSLQKPKLASTKPTTATSPGTATATQGTTVSNIPTILLNGEELCDEKGCTDSDKRPEKVEVNGFSEKSEFLLDTCFVVRSSSSATLFRDDTEDEEEGEEGDDTFCEEFLFSIRPRTSSMRTSREMAAMARRRGSKELF